MKTFLTLTTLGSLLAAGCVAADDVYIKEEAKEIVKISVIPHTFTCPECTVQEKMALKAFQEQGITDRYALSALMGNIKQESNFINNICEGGARTGYHGCHRGGFGLIQWTTKSRYDGLGWYARKHGLDPNGMQAQLGWMVEEQQWKKVDYIWKTPGKSINQYMNAAYKWLGWGIHGARTTFSYQYFDRLSET